MKSVLHGFLGTLRSRYAAHEGFWLFGFLVPDRLRRDVDLRASGLEAAGAEMSLDRRARSAFADQLRKHGFSRDALKAARVTVEIIGRAQGMQGGIRAGGFVVRATAHVVLDSGRVYQAVTDFFVAPHDPSREQRSYRGRTA